MTMTRATRLRVSIAGAVVLTAAIVGIDVAESGSSAAPVSSAPGATVVKTRSTDLGQILVDGQGRTLYLFGKDKSTVSNCSGECTTDWPPVPVTGAPQAGDGASAASIGVTMSADGAKQLAYAGHPLYYFSGDNAAGQTRGQGIDEFGAKWWVLNPAGVKVTAAPTSSGNSGGGYSY